MVVILTTWKVMKFALTALSRDDNFYCGIEWEFFIPIVLLP